MNNLTEEKILAIVSNCVLFKDVDKEIFKSHIFDSQFENLKNYKKGELILKQDTVGNSLFVVVEGKVEIKQDIGLYVSKSLCTFAAGDFFGEMALMVEGGHHNASAVSVEDGTACLEISRSFFDFIIENIPKASSIVLRNICERNNKGLDLLKADLNNSFQSIIHAMGKIAEYRDPETASHLRRVSMYVTVLSKWLMGKPGFEEINFGFLELIGLSSPLHDIGKVGIPDSILLKPGKLDPDEWEIMKKHSIYGGDAIQNTLSQFCYPKFLEMGRNIALYHHEKWDGGGYPEGLKGNEIPLEARIMAIADIYDALRQKRCYKDAFSHSKTKEMIFELENNHLDGRLVREFTNLDATFEKVFDQNNEGE